MTFVLSHVWKYMDRAAQMIYEQGDRNQVAPRSNPQLNTAKYYRVSRKFCGNLILRFFGQTAKINSRKRKFPQKLFPQNLIPV